MRSGSWRLFDHTADLGIEVSSGTLEGLFENAARALFAQIGSMRPAPAPAPAERHLEIESADPVETLIRWLAELLFLHETEGLFFDDFRVEFPDTGTGARRIRATARDSGAARNPGDGAREIKAVTYHASQIHQGSDGVWKARFVLDI